MAGGVFMVKGYAMYIYLLILLLLPSSAFAVADRIIGTEAGTGIMEELTPSEASNLIGVAGGLEATHAAGNEITGATSALPLTVGNGAQKLDIYGDATDGGVVKPVPLGDSLWRCWTNYNCVIRDMEAGASILTIDPDAATRLGITTWGTNYRPLKSVYLSADGFQGDGTQCPARPTVVTISNMAMPTFICTENNSARIRRAFPMPPNWDGGVVYIQPYYSQTAADTGSVLLEVAAACRALGTAFNGTYGTEIDVTDAVLVGSGAIEGTLSAAVTPNGTCAANDFLFLYIDVDATANPTTAAATLNLIGARVFWSETSLSH